MLAFIKRKLSESDSTTNSNAGTADQQLARRTSQMSLNSNETVDMGEDALLKELGYKNATDLQETVYGKFCAKYSKISFIISLIFSQTV